jgi:hypothetical protein
VIQVHVQSDPAGCLVISGQPAELDNPWGVTPFKKVCQRALIFQLLLIVAVVQRCFTAGPGHLASKMNKFS